MPFQEDDREFFRQLAWLYPADYVQELRQLAAEVLQEQLLAGERQDIREIVYNITEKLSNTAKEDTAGENEAAAQHEAYLKAQEQELSERAAELLVDGQSGYLAGFGPPVAAYLAAALTDKSAGVAQTAYEALLNLEDGATIDAFCQLWEETRRQDLERILLQKGYLAAKPLRLRVLTVLKTGADSYMLAMNFDTLTAILEATGDNDRQIAARAEEMLLSLESQSCVDIFCQMALDNPDDKKLLALAMLAGHAPSAPPRAALFYCLTGQWEEYYAFDWQKGRPLLQRGYAEASPREKESFLASAAREGHSRLAVEIILNCDKKQELLKITELIWTTIIENIAARQDWEFLAELILETPPEISWKIMSLLRQSAWSPSRQDLRKLLALCPPETGREDLFAPDGREVAILSLSELGATAQSLAFHPTEQIFAVGGADGAVRFWHLGESRPWRTVTLAEEGICALAFTSDGRLLAAASRDGKVNIWNMPDVTWAAAIKGATGQAISIGINNAGHILAAAKDSPASSAPIVRLWHWDGVSMTNKALLPQSIFTLPVIHSGRLFALAVGAAGQIRAWPQKTGQISSFTQHGQAKLQALAITPCGSLAGAIDGNGCLHIWSVETGRLLAVMPARKTYQGGLALSGGGALAAVTCMGDNTITIYQTRWTKPLAVATWADFTHAAKMAKWKNDIIEINTYQYLASLLSAKEL